MGLQVTKKLCKKGPGTKHTYVLLSLFGSTGPSSLQVRVSFFSSLIYPNARFWSPHWTQALTGKAQAKIRPWEEFRGGKGSHPQRLHEGFIFHSVETRDEVASGPFIWRFPFLVNAQEIIHEIFYLW